MGDALKVLFVIDGLGTGGSERSLAEMLPRLRDLDVTPVIACLHRRPEGVERSVLDQDFDVRFLGSTGIPGRARELRRLINEERPTLVHTTHFHSSVAARIAAAGTGRPVLTSLVNTPYDIIRQGDVRVRASSLAIVRIVDGWTARHLTSHFHAVSSAVRDAAVAALGIAPESVTVIHRGRDEHRLGVASDERRRSVRRALGLSDHDRVVMTVGRQEWQKGHLHLLDAVLRLLPRYPDLRVLVAGRSGHASQDLDARMRADPILSEHVHFLGHRDDVPDLLAASDLFVLPSLFEGIPGSAIEAMALGLPVVLSDLPGMDELVEPGRSAELVPRGDPVALANGMDLLLSDPARARAYGERGRAIFTSRFTLQASTERMRALYAEIGANAGARLLEHS